MADAVVSTPPRKTEDQTYDAVTTLKQELQRLLETAPATAPPELVQETEENFKGFAALFERFLRERKNKISWDKIKPPAENLIAHHADLAKAPEDPSSMLSKLAVLKLNGGLGTSMGCEGPKSVISVRDDQTFLDLCVHQLECLNSKHNVDVPLVLMNSFNTHADTKKVLRKYQNLRCRTLDFNQSKYPRISKETLTPVPNSIDSKDNWYPPGHGDLYLSLYKSGTLQQLIDMGVEYIFISNIDNLGATVDLEILNYLVNEHPECEFLMEVTAKTRADVKGGTLIEYEGVPRLLEIAQVPKENLEEFKSVKKFKIFNTNNLWIKLSAIKRLCEAGDISMEIIENKKTTDTGLQVIQLETAVGSAIKSFQNGKGIDVPRSRFLPVKKTSDLLLVMSNLYTLHDGQLLMSSARMFPAVPLVKLGTHFDKVKDFLSRFDSIPDIVELDHLTVTGDVNFGANVTLKGTVIIVANHGDRIDIPANSTLENKVVSGNLRILDH